MNLLFLTFVVFSSFLHSSYGACGPYKQFVFTTDFDKGSEEYVSSPDGKKLTIAGEERREYKLFQLDLSATSGHYDPLPFGEQEFPNQAFSNGYWMFYDMQKLHGTLRFYHVASKTSFDLSGASVLDKLRVGSWLRLQVSPDGKYAVVLTYNGHKDGYSWNLKFPESVAFKLPSGEKLSSFKFEERMNDLPYPLNYANAQYAESLRFSPDGKSVTVLYGIYSDATKTQVALGHERYPKREYTIMEKFDLEAPSASWTRVGLYRMDRAELQGWESSLVYGKLVKQGFTKTEIVSTKIVYTDGKSETLPDQIKTTEFPDFFSYFKLEADGTESVFAKESSLKPLRLSPRGNLAVFERYDSADHCYDIWDIKTDKRLYSVDWAMNTYVEHLTDAGTLIVRDPSYSWDFKVYENSLP